MTPPRSPAPRPFGKYLLDREIARGGMARVHLARLRGLGGFEKRLVLKEIDPKLASDPRFVTLFVEEANTLVQMSHPHIVPVYELGIVEGTYFLAMEHVHGATLEALVAERPLEPEEVAHVGAQIADALAYAHERFSLVHRDVTPRNVMIDAHGHARLLDFGIAARLDEGEGEGAVFGTPGYLSPEQARGERLSPASDLFALGAVLHRASTAQHAFAANVEAARALQAPAALPALDALPPELARILRGALEPDVAKRPASGKALAAQLRAFLAARRPEGVADALGARADALAREQEQALEAHAHEELVTPPTSGRTQSLATSPVLNELFDDLAPTRTTPAHEGAQEGTHEGTQRLERPRPPQAPTPALAPTAAGRALTTAGLTLILAAGAAWALSYARFETPTSDPGPRALEATPLERDPPDAGAETDASAPSLDAADLDTNEVATDADMPDAGTAASDAAPRRATDARGVEVRFPTTATPGAGTSSSTGSLTVQALPWADVWVDGARIGRTPLRAHALSAGPHTLSLRCPPLGREVSRQLDIREGVTTRLSANLQTSPPTLSER